MSNVERRDGRYRAMPVSAIAGTGHCRTVTVAIRHEERSAWVHVSSLLEFQEQIEPTPIGDSAPELRS
ncbi:MAG: hypothetical protein WBM50_21995 [Acidimicrobiales bacterium]